MNKSYENILMLYMQRLELKRLPSNEEQIKEKTGVIHFYTGIMDLIADLGDDKSKLVAMNETNVLRIVRHTVSGKLFLKFGPKFGRK